MKKLISYCLYDNKSMYLEGAIENIKYAKEVYPDWICRYYCHISVPNKYIKQLIELGAEVFIINDKKADTNLNWVKLWRFYPCSEKDIEYIIFRDTDSRLSYKEKAAVDDWIKAGTNYHILHDSEAHGSIICAGMWGCKGDIIPNIYSLIDTYLEQDLNGDSSKCLWNSDQLFLEKYVFPLVISSSYTAHGTNKHMKTKYPQLKTLNYPKNKGFKTIHEKFIGQKMYKNTLNTKSINNIKPINNTNSINNTNNIINVYHIEHHSNKKTWVALRCMAYITQINNNIKLVDNIDNAHIIVGSYEKSLQQFIDKHKDIHNLNDKHFLVWCLEPKWSISGVNLIDYNEFKIHIMNCYTADVYVSPYQFCQIFSHKHFDPIKLNKLMYDNTKTKIVVIATAKNNNSAANIVVPGKNLVSLRYKIAMEMYNTDNDSIHIYGKNWPNDVARTYVGKETLVYREKMDILKDYYFNMCFENTSHDNYVTEKIWHSIIGGCLPIYYGNPSIYTVFPENSFIDTTKFKTSKQLLAFINNMSYEEYYKRFQICYNIIKNIKPIVITNCNTLIKQKLEQKFNTIYSNN